MKLRKLTAALLAAATVLCASGCQDTATPSGSGDNSAASSNSASDNTSSDTSSDTSGGNATPTSDWEFGQVAMGGGGFVSGVFATKEEGLYYARTDVGGAYRYDSEKGKWVSLAYWVSEEDRGLLGIDGLAFAENEPNKLYLIAGTDYFSNGKTCLLISEDYGDTFEMVDLTDTIRVSGNGMGRGNGERIAVDPKNSDIVYIGGRTGGMIKSTDGGKTFTSLDMGTKTSTSNGNGINSIIIVPDSGDDNGCSTIYASLSRIQDNNLYKSTDGGSTWAPVESAPKGLMVQRMKYCDGKLYITYADKEGPWNNNRTSGGIRVLDCANDEMTEISPMAKAFGDIVIDPTNPDRMVACTENIYVPQANGAFGDEFYVTTDGGASWKMINEDMTMSTGGIDWIASSSMHWCSSMCIDPNDPNKIMVDSGNGIFACDNIWDEHPEFYFNAKGIEETVPAEMVSIKGGKLVTAIYDYDGFAQDDATQYGTVHSSIAGSMTSIAVAAQAKDVWVKCGGDSSNPGFWYTEDAGANWTNVKTSPIKGTVSYQGCVAVSCDGKTFFWSPSSSTDIYYTTDKGKTWNKSEGGLGAVRITCDPVNPDYVYASSGSYFYMSEDGGKTFTANNELAVFSASRPIVTPDIEGKVYFCAMGLQVSEDHGKTFTRIDSVAACLAVGLGKGKTDNDPYTIFIWGKPTNNDELGLYWSEDEGKTWSRVNDSAHMFGGPGNGYFVYGDFNVYGRCYMSTVGLGMIYADYKG